MSNLTPDEQLYAGLQLTRPLLRNITSRVEADLAGTGVTVGQRAILEVLLTQKQLTAPELTKQLQVTRQFVGRELKALLDKGFVETKPNPKHLNSSFYSLNAQSRDIITDIRTQETERIRGFALQFTPAEIAAFYKIQCAMNQEFSPD